MFRSKNRMAVEESIQTAMAMGHSPRVQAGNVTGVVVSANKRTVTIQRERDGQQETFNWSSVQKILGAAGQPMSTVAPKQAKAIRAKDFAQHQEDFLNFKI